MYPPPLTHAHTARDELTIARDRLLNGLYKLNETNQLVDRMKADLAELQPVLESKSKATAELLTKVAADQDEAEKVKRTVATEERDVKQMQAETQVRGARRLIGWGEAGGGTGADRQSRRGWRLME